MANCIRPPEAWRSPGPVSTWGVWRPLCAELGGNPAGFSKENHPSKKPIRFVEIYRKSVWEKNGTSKYGVFLKWWQPTTIGFPTKNDHFGGFGGKTPFEETPICQPISRKKSGRRWCESLQTNDLWDSTAPKAVSYETNPCWIWYWWDMSQKGPKINERFLVFFGSPILSHLLTPDISWYYPLYTWQCFL